MTITVDNTAKVSGFTTGLISWLSGTMAIAFHPGESRPLVQVVVTVIGGLFGLAGTSLAIILAGRIGQVN